MSAPDELWVTEFGTGLIVCDPASRNAVRYIRAPDSATPECSYCTKFFSRYRCNAPLECDCPKCQGMCECAALRDPPDSAPNGLADDVRQRLERAAACLHVCAERDHDFHLNNTDAAQHSRDLIAILAALRNQPGGAAPRGDEFKAGADAMRNAAVTMLERAKQPAAAIGVALMKLPDAATKAGEGETSATDERERG